MYKTTNKVHISGDLRTIHYKAMYTGGNLTIRAQNLCRTETLPELDAMNNIEGHLKFKMMAIKINL